jgi:RHS repeat-associated protein
VVLPAGTTDAFTYNGDGQRVQKVDSGGTTNFVWDGQNVLLEASAGNVIQAVYTLEPQTYGNLVSQRRGGATSFYHFDGLGSTIQLTGAAGSVTDSYLYDSWGNFLATTGSTSNPFRFVGRSGYYQDPDLPAYYVRARYYDSGKARFLSSDSWSHQIPAIGFYVYANNNPILNFDPSGHVAISYNTSVNGKKFYNCGAFEWNTYWKIEPSYNKKGIIVQKVEWNLNGFRCGCPDTALTKQNILCIANGVDCFTYWEVWFVDSNKVRTEWFYGPGNSFRDDTFSLVDTTACPLKNTRGTLEIKGTATFYEWTWDPKNVVASLPSTFGTNGNDIVRPINRPGATPCPLSNYLYSTYQDPSKPPNVPTLPAKGLSVTNKHIKLQWNCCPNSTDTGTKES